MVSLIIVVQNKKADFLLGKPALILFRAKHKPILSYWQPTYSNSGPDYYSVPAADSGCL